MGPSPPAYVSGYRVFSKPTYDVSRTMASGSSCKSEAKIFAASGGAWPDPAMRMTIMNWDFDSCSQTQDSPSYGGVVLGSFGGFDFCWSFRLPE